VEISPADLEIICLQEITDGKIYSPVGSFAEWAKKEDREQKQRTSDDTQLW